MTSKKTSALSGVSHLRQSNKCARLGTKKTAPESATNTRRDLTINTYLGGAWL